MSTINYQIEDDYHQSLQDRSFPESSQWEYEIPLTEDEQRQDYQDALDRDTAETIREFRSGNW